MNNAKKKPDTRPSAGPNPKGSHSYYDSNSKPEIKSIFGPADRLRADRLALGHKQQIERIHSRYHRKNPERKYMLYNVEKLIRDRHGSSIPETDDTNYFEVVARNIDDYDFFSEWCANWAPWISNKLLKDIFNKRKISEFDFLPDEVAKLLNVKKDEYETLKLYNIGHIELTQKQRCELAAEIKRENDRINKETERRKNGVKPRAEYEKNSISKTKPWVKLGISERTYYRRKASK